MLDLRVVWQRAILIDLTVNFSTLLGPEEVPCEFDKLTVGEVVKNIHSFTEIKANHHVKKADIL